MLMSLPVVNGTRITIDETLASINSLLLKFENTTDFKTGSANLDIANFSKLVDVLIDNEGMFTDPTLYEQFTIVKTRMKAILLKLPNEAEDQALRARFIGKIVM